jgi:hypothetical protein
MLDETTNVYLLSKIIINNCVADAMHDWGRRDN